MKFFTDSKKRIRPLSHRHPSTQTYQQGVAHLNVPRRINNSHLQYPIDSVYSNPNLYVDNRTGKNLKIVWMSPEKFLKQCTSPNYFNKDSNENAFTAKEGYNREIVDNYKKIMQTHSEDIPALLLDYTDKGRSGLPAHNGRHRAKAALELGIKKVPVVEVTNKPQKKLSKSSLQPLLTDFSQRSTNGNLYRVTRFRGNRNGCRVLVDVTKFHNGSKPDYDLKIEKDGKEVLVKSYGTEEELLNTLQEYTK